MQGLRIYYVPPRLAGTVDTWSGLSSPGGASWLLDRAEDLGFNAVWFSPLQVTSQVEKVHEGRTVKGSLYALRNHFALDREFSGEPGMRPRSTYAPAELARIDAENERHLRHFTGQAAKKGITVFGDLVLNHIAADHPLVREENQVIEEILKKEANVVPVYKGQELIGLSWRDGGSDGQHVRHFKFRRRADYTPSVGGPPDDPWSDVAQINYDSPEGMRFFVEGDRDTKAYWKQVVDWHLDLGFTGFRCDVAYKIPPACWQEIAAYTRARHPDAVFLAETLGGSDPDVERMASARSTTSEGARPAFDLGMLSTYWWNFRDKWLPEGENPRIQRMSRHGGAGFPDNHDTPETLAGHFARALAKTEDKEAKIAALCLRNYAVAALACHSHYMQMGYELCKETQNRVFRGHGSPQEWRDLVADRAAHRPALDISGGIRRINKIKAALETENTRVVFEDTQSLKKDELIRIRCSYVDLASGTKKAEAVLLLNARPERGAVEADLDKALPGIDWRAFDRNGEPSRPGEAQDVRISDVMIFTRRMAVDEAQRQAKPPVQRSRFFPGA